MVRWSSTTPIYQQVCDRMMAALVDSGADDGAPLPSVRELSRTYLVNPLTVIRALDALRSRGWIEARPGVGHVLCAGATRQMIEHGRQHFLHEEWPALRRHLVRLGISASDMR